MKKVLQLVIISLFFFSCDLTTEKELFFLEKNAYEYPVWEEMLLEEKVKFSDVVQAFKAYSSTHRLDEETLEHFEKLENRIKPNLDSEGYYISKLGQYKKLLAFRQATRGKDTTHTDYTRQATSFRAEIPNNANYGQWKNEGPFGDPEIRWSATGNGAVQYLEMHPTNPAIMYACTRNGGLWKTINYGKNWTPETDYFATNNTSCMEICPANPSIFYLGAAEDQKVWYSTDSGVNWEDRSLGISGSIYDIHSDPTDATRVLAATSKGIYLTTDSGLNWTQKLSGRYTDIDLTDNWDFIVVSDDNANVTPVLNFSKDKGDTFIEKNIITHLTEVDRFYLAIHKPTTGATQVFAYGLDDSNTPTRFIGLWKSDYDPNPADGTSYFNFTEVKHPTYTYPNGAVPLAYNTNADGFTEETSDYYGSINPYSQATWISDFYVSPNNPDWMLTLREKFWGSDDGGIIWSRKPSYGSSNWADNRYVTTNVAKDTVYWTNDGGMWAIKENDLFPTEAAVTASGLSESAYINSKVVHKNGDICVPEGSQMDVSQMNKGVFMTGGQDVGQIFTRNGRDSHVASADVYRGRIKPTDDSKLITLGDYLPEENILREDANTEDPHIWFNVLNWKIAAEALMNKLKDIDSSNSSAYDTTGNAYMLELDDLHQYVLDKVSELAEEERVLVTAHDAFNYFGNTYGFDVYAIQGISTESEPSVSDIQDLAILVKDLDVNAIFVESSVPEATINSVIEAAAQLDHTLVVGGELYSDSLGDSDHITETYILTVNSNVDTIVDALK
mgnify:CR=1 FL=1